jgi:hypothetical protein
MVFLMVPGLGVVPPTPAQRTPPHFSFSFPLLWPVSSQECPYVTLGVFEHLRLTQS